MPLVRKTYISSKVRELLAEHDIQPSTAVNVAKIAKSFGIKIVEAPADDGLSGFLLREQNDENVVIGVNSNHPRTRRLFTIAHELGHYLLHNYEGFHFDGVDNGFQLRFRDDRSKDGTDLDEREANLFAAELLMPEEFLQADIKELGPIDLLGDLAKLEKLARRYKVSSQAMSIRLQNLGFVR